jgi:hypothetical protein
MKLQIGTPIGSAILCAAFETGAVAADKPNILGNIVRELRFSQYTGVVGGGAVEYCTESAQ